QNDVTLKMPAFEWVHVQLHQQKGMISLSPPTICNSAKKKDAAEHAEHFLSKIRWVPEWMTSADNQKQPAAKSELSLATSQNDTDADAGDVTDHNNPACAA
ncbi:hypothetical protein AB8S84_28300, partial [Klebsiella pneumoniae subsp. ozaenae]